MPPTAFVLFLQNHDQIGNRAFGERLTTLAAAPALEAAIALQMLCAANPAAVHGRGRGEPRRRSCSSPIIDGDLAGIVREGRRSEFARFAVFADPVKREQIPDPNAPETFRASIPRPDPERGIARRDYYARLLTVRREEIIPRLPGCRAIGATVLGEAAVMARWRMGDGAIHVIATNLGSVRVPLAAPGGRLLFESAAGAGAAVRAGYLPPQATVGVPGARAMSDAALRDLAGRAGILVEWRDAAGRPQEVAPDVLRRVLKALRLPCDTDAETRESAERLARLPNEAPPPAAAAERCFAFDPAQRMWGVAAQLYGLRRAGDCGIGDFAAVAALAESAARQGADAVALSPVHALFAADSRRYGPYSPSSRLFLNPLYADLEDGLCAADDAGDMVDWPTAAADKFAAFRRLFAPVSRRPTSSRNSAPRAA